MSIPGSSFLWVGEYHHLNRKEVQELVERMVFQSVNGFLAVETAMAASNTFQSINGFLGQARNGNPYLLAFVASPKLSTSRATS